MKSARHIGSAVGALVLATVALLWFVSLISADGPALTTNPALASIGPSGEHWLGTDHLGRDVAWRLVTASEAFVGPGTLAVGLALALGVSLGALAAWLDVPDRPVGRAFSALVRFNFTVWASLPRFVLVLVACLATGSSVWLIAVVAGVAFSPVVGEAVHARLETFRRAEFVLAAQAHGVGPGRVLLFHLLWVNCRRLVARYAVQLFAAFLLLETTLSFLGALDAGSGFGVQEPDPSWGNMLAFEWRRPDTNRWASWAPGLSVWAVIFGAALLSDALAEADA